MGRPAKFSEGQILDAATHLLAQRPARAVTVGSIAEELGAPTGSLYHRFASRDLLLATLWTRIAARSQDGFLTALSQPDIEQAALDAALHLPRWSRHHREEATVMLLHRHRDLAESWPYELGAELERQASVVIAALRAYARRRFGRAGSPELRCLNFALLDTPYAAVRRYLLVGRVPPLQIDELIAEVCTCVLDRSSVPRN